MINDIGFKIAGLLAAFVQPKNLISLAKYMYIKNLLDHYRIEVILDVGANVGQFAKAMRRIGYKGKIVSFEPVSTQFEHLARAADGDSNWRVHNFALSDVAGKQPINVMASSVFSSFHEPATLSDGNTVVRTEIAELRTLSEVADEFGFADCLGRTFLKCDTQGFDLRVLRGAGEKLRAVRLLQVELSITKAYENAPGITDTLAFIEAYGFAPVAMFPINKLPDWSADEMDYVGVNRSLGSFCEIKVR